MRETRRPAHTGYANRRRPPRPAKTTRSASAQFAAPAPASAARSCPVPTITQRQAGRSAGRARPGARSRWLAAFVRLQPRHAQADQRLRRQAPACPQRRLPLGDDQRRARLRVHAVRAAPPRAPAARPASGITSSRSDPVGGDHPVGGLRARRGTWRGRARRPAASSGWRTLKSSRPCGFMTSGATRPSGLRRRAGCRTPQAHSPCAWTTSHAPARHRLPPSPAPSARQTADSWSAAPRSSWAAAAAPNTGSAPPAAARPPDSGPRRGRPRRPGLGKQRDIQPGPQQLPGQRRRAALHPAIAVLREDGPHEVGDP